jgi:gas vesicle protein
MNNYVVKTQDRIVEQVIEKIDQRSLVGQKKYGAMMMEEVVDKKKDLNDFLTDVQEEIMDALLYIQAAKHCLQDEIEEAMLRRIEVHDEETI